jgi:hypothetical protein
MAVATSPRSKAGSLGLIGRDLGASEPAVALRRWLPVIVATIAVAIGIAALRIDLFRIQYALGEALEQEQSLLEQQRALTVRKRQLRDPAVLERRARELGFQRPVRLVDLPSSPVQLIPVSPKSLLATAIASAAPPTMDSP